MGDHDRFCHAHQERARAVQDRSSSGGAGMHIHDKFVVVDFNAANPTVFTGSSNLASGGEQANGDSLAMIEDAAVANMFAIEAVALFDHYHFRKVMQQVTVKQPPLTLWYPGKPNARDRHGGRPITIQARIQMRDRYVVCRSAAAGRSCRDQECRLVGNRRRRGEQEAGREQIPREDIGREVFFQEISFQEVSFEVFLPGSLLPGSLLPKSPLPGSPRPRKRRRRKRRKPEKHPSANDAADAGTRSEQPVLLPVAFGSCSNFRAVKAAANLAFVPTSLM